MIIDCHAHLSAPQELHDYRSWLIKTRGREGRGDPLISDDAILKAMHLASSAPFSHLGGIERAGISIQLLSPRPNQMMHSQQPGEIVKWYAQASNDLVYRYTRIWPGMFIGIASLPQMAGEDLEEPVLELRRCVNQLGFRGCILNPDPYENTGEQSRPLWDPYWFPLYEALCDLDVPCHIHATGKPSPREIYNHYYIHEESVAALAFVSSDILDLFPRLKVVVSHGGGSIPFQIGRYIAGERTSKNRDFYQRMRRIYFDTVLHNPAAVEYLIKTAGVKNCLFGTEWPGLGSVIEPRTGHVMDNLAPAIRAIPWLKQADIEDILWRNAVEVFGLDRQLP